MAVGFVEALARALKERGVGTHLETNGTLAAEMNRVRDLVEWVAMDMKLPSSAGVEPLWERHDAFLRAARGTSVFVKIVVTPGTLESDVATAARAVAGVDRTIPLVLQPVTPAREIAGAPRPEQMRTFESIAMKYLENVRVIPQVHRILGER